MSVVGLGGALAANSFGAIKGLKVRRAYLQDAQNTNNTIVTVDASVKESHSIEAPPSEFPIESGQMVADNFIIKPFQLEMQGTISDNPISVANAAVTTAISTIVPPTGIIAGGTALALFSALQGSTRPSVQNFNQFLSILINKNVINVYTTLNFYKSMWLSSLRVERDSKSGNSLDFTAKFVQVILVQPQTVNVAKYASAISAGLANLGKSTLSNSKYLAAFNNGVVTGTSNANSAANTFGIGGG